jgi:hypothetical protein
MSWIKKGITLNGENVTDRFGRAVTTNADGSIIAVAANGVDFNLKADSGRIYTYKWDPNLNAYSSFGNSIGGSEIGDGVGFGGIDLSDDGTTLAFGIHTRDSGVYLNVGKAEIYKYSSSNDTWDKIGDILPDTNNDLVDINKNGEQCGWCVSLNGLGTRVAVASRYATYETKTRCGRVRVFQYNGNTTWNQLGQDVSGISIDDWFGFRVSLNSQGNILAVGAPNNSSNTTRPGYAKIYIFSNNRWEQLGQTLSVSSTSDEFGRCLALNTYGNILAVASNIENNDGISGAGAVRTYYYNSSTPSTPQWTTFGSPLRGSTQNANFGFSVSIDGPSADLSGINLTSSNTNLLSGTTLIVGSQYAQNTSNIGTGAVYIYRYINGNWVLLKTIYGNNSTDIAGFSSVIKGKTMVYGAPSTANNQTGFAEVYNFVEKKTRISGFLSHI